VTIKDLYQKARIKWSSLYEGDVIHILIGTATCGRAAGSMAVLEEFKRCISNMDVPVSISEVGCMGLCSYEPLVIIIKPGNVAICYHHINEQTVPQLVERYIKNDDPCLELALGTVVGGGGEPVHIPELELFSYQQRLLMRNCGYNSPLEIDHYIACGGYSGLARALRSNPAEIIGEVEKSCLRGRGGAGYPAADKLRHCYMSPGDTKYVVCNADEGDPGAFMDRLLLESDPHSVLEGMAIAGYAIGAERGFIYVREEYPLAIHRLQTALAQAVEKGVLGTDVLGSGYKFDIEIVRGAGAFISGEETATIAAIEGRRSWPRHRPPYPSQCGLWGRPTLVNNVKTLAFFPLIISKGGDWFASIGNGKDTGTVLFALAGKLVNTGLVEVPAGTKLSTIIFDIGGGIRSGKQFKAVQIGGPSGGCLPQSLLDTPVDFDSLRQAGAIMGSGGIIVMDEDNCMVDTARYFLDFSSKESCGKCTPCRDGIHQMLGILEDFTTGQGDLSELDRLERMAEDMKQTSLCGLGKMAPNPVLTTLRYFRDEYIAHLVEKRCPARVCKELTAYYILPQKCYRGCDHCVLACPAEAIYGDDNGLKVIDQAKCTKCGSCELVCPPEYNAVVRLSPVSLVPPERRSKTSL